jgi:hypothetical protein
MVALTFPFSCGLINKAEYLSKRKFTLVNGMHTVMAFLTLIKTYDKDHQGSGEEDEGNEAVLLKYSQLGRDDQVSYP